MLFYHEVKVKNNNESSPIHSQHDYISGILFKIEKKKKRIAIFYPYSNLFRQPLRISFSITFKVNSINLAQFLKVVSSVKNYTYQWRGRNN